MTKSQFTQIAMIAQGDFLKLLLSTTEERKAIFSRIFCTEPYRMLQEKLKADYLQLDSDINIYIKAQRIALMKLSSQGKKTMYFGHLKNRKTDYLILRIFWRR